MKKCLCIGMSLLLLCAGGCGRDEITKEDYTDPTEEVKTAVKTKTDGYLGRVDTEKRTLEFYPLHSISYEEYIAALESGNKLTKDGREFEIVIDEEELYSTGLITLIDKDGGEYSVYEPQEGQTSAIEGYRGSDRIEFKFDDETKVRYGVLGFDTGGNITGYEPCGFNVEYSFEEYYGNIKKMEFAWGRYVVESEDGEVIKYLNVLYHP